MVTEAKKKLTFASQMVATMSKVKCAGPENCATQMVATMMVCRADGCAAEMVATAESSIHRR